MTITESTTVADIASSHPSSVRLFQQHGIDFCCGGKTALALARSRGAAGGAMVQMLQRSGAKE